LFVLAARSKSSQKRLLLDSTNCLQVGVFALREVKNDLSRVIRALPWTGPILITKRGKASAVLLPVSVSQDELLPSDEQIASFRYLPARLTPASSHSTTSGRCPPRPMAASICGTPGASMLPPALGYQAVVGDFTGDAKPDIAVLQCNGRIALFRGLGDATFYGPTNFASTTEEAYSLGAGDCNGDGKLDLVTGGVELLS
jgi:prevent-host-death family protein